MGLFVTLNSDHLWKGGLQSHTSGWLGAQWSPCLELLRSPSTGKSHFRNIASYISKPMLKKKRMERGYRPKLCVIETHRWQLRHTSHLDNLGSIWELKDIISIFAKISKPTPPPRLPPRLPPTATLPPPQDHLAGSEWVSRGVNPRLRAGPGTRRDLTFVWDVDYVLLSNSRSCPWSCPRCCPCCPDIVLVLVEDVVLVWEDLTWTTAPPPPHQDLSLPRWL